jgi:hypothetical protein
MDLQADDGGAQLNQKRLMLAALSRERKMFTSPLRTIEIFAATPKAQQRRRDLSLPHREVEGCITPQRTIHKTASKAHRIRHALAR